MCGNEMAYVLAGRTGELPNLAIHGIFGGCDAGRLSVG
jgi:hypothetical protein